MRPRPITVIGEVAFVPLTQGCAAMIDAADAGLVAPHNWTLSRDSHTCYAHRRRRKSEPGPSHIKLHRALLVGSQEVDHRNGNGLDNRRANIRPCTHAENTRSRRANRGTASRFKGVSRQGSRWQAALGGAYLGCFATQEEAARAYDDAARAAHGDFAVLNLPGDPRFDAQAGG